MNPFECSICKKHVHGRNINDLKCCPNAKFIALTRICLLGTEKDLPNNTIVHTSPEHYEKPVPSGQKWATFCNAPSLRTPNGQRVVTRHPTAATCKRCLDVYEQKRKEAEERQYLESIEFIDQ